MFRTSALSTRVSSIVLTYLRTIYILMCLKSQRAVNYFDWDTYANRSGTKYIYARRRFHTISTVETPYSNNQRKHIASNPLTFPTVCRRLLTLAPDSRPSLACHHPIYYLPINLRNVTFTLARTRVRVAWFRERAGHGTLAAHARARTRACRCVGGRHQRSAQQVRGDGWH